MKRVVTLSKLMGLALGAVWALLLILGSVRYDGPEGLLLRVRAEIAARRPHPQFVPTPLPTPTVGRVDNSSYPAGTTPPAPSPTLPTTPTPSPTPAQLSPSPTVGPSLSPTSTPTASPTATPTLAQSPHPPTVGPPPDPTSTPTVSPTETSTSTPSPTETPTSTPSPTATPTPAHRPAAAAVELTGLSHMWQTWNNCGPATLAMNLSYFGSRLSQAEVGAALRHNWDDKNVSPAELAAFARAQGLQALVRVNGDADRLRLLLSNGVPVLIETWLIPEPGNGMGHYRLLTGYDDVRREWIAYDSYVSIGVDPNKPYRGIRLSYDEVARLWTVFNRTYILIYTDDLAPAVRSILGQEADDATMWQQALLTAQQEVEQRPDDPFAWFNLGTDLTALGQFEEAAAAYDRARVIGLPWRMLWYQFGPFRAYYETGRYQELIALADATIKTAGSVEELYYWKGLGLQATSDLAGARQAFQRALTLNPNYDEAAAALARISE